MTAAVATAIVAMLPHAASVPISPRWPKMPYKGKPLNYTIFHQQAKQAEIIHAKQIDFALQNQRKAHKSAPNHPWRKGFATLFSKQNVPQGDISTSRD
ncbi:MAG: hypothetical protein ABIL11_06445 [Chloroflexota bacterium]